MGMGPGKLKIIETANINPPVILATFGTFDTVPSFDLSDVVTAGAAPKNTLAPRISVPSTINTPTDWSTCKF